MRSLGRGREPVALEPLRGRNEVMETILQGGGQDRIEFEGAAVIAAYLVGALAMYLQYVRPF